MVCNRKSVSAANFSHSTAQFFMLFLPLFISHFIPWLNIPNFENPTCRDTFSPHVTHVITFSQIPTCSLEMGCFLCGAFFSCFYRPRLFKLLGAGLDLISPLSYSFKAGWYYLTGHESQDPLCLIRSQKPSIERRDFNYTPGEQLVICQMCRRILYDRRENTF